MNNYDLLKFVKVTEDDLLRFISNAKKRIIYAKSAFTKKEIEYIIETIDRNKIDCNLYIEAGDKAIRFGFGETEALELINNNLEKIKLQITDKIRMAILIVDNETLMYSPNISFIEEDLYEMTFPNGLFGRDNITELLLEEFDIKEKIDIDPMNESKIIPFPGCDIPKLQQEDTKAAIQEYIEVLSKNPAVDPSKLRKTNFYRNNYKILKKQVMGIKIENKKISLRPFLSLLENNNEKDIRSWGIFSKEDIKNLQDTIEFERELDSIFKRYLLDAGRFGYILDINLKDKFLKEVNDLQAEFTEYFKGSMKQPENNKFFKKKVARNKDEMTSLDDLLAKSKNELVEKLMDISKDDEDFINIVCSRDRQISVKLKNKEINEVKARRDFIEWFAMNVLKFPLEQDIFDKIDVKIDFYDISDELLYENKDFQELLEEYKKSNKNEHGIEVREYKEGFENIES